GEPGPSPPAWVTRVSAVADQPDSRVHRSLRQTAWVPVQPSRQPASWSPSAWLLAGVPPVPGCPQVTGAGTTGTTVWTTDRAACGAAPRPARRGDGRGDDADGQPVAGAAGLAEPEPALEPQPGRAVK